MKKKCRLFQDRLNLPIKAKTKMQHYNRYFELVQGALAAKKIEKEFSSRRLDKGKKKINFSLAKSWFQKFKGPQRSGQSSTGYKTPMDSSRKSMPTSVTSPTRRSTSYAGVPPSTGSRVTRRVPKLSCSYSRGMKVPQCDRCGRVHHGECKLGQ